MEKAILSRINLQRQDTHIAQEYFDTISDEFIPKTSLMREFIGGSAFDVY